MGPGILVLCGIVLLIAIGVFIRTALYDRAIRKEMTGFIKEIDAKLSRAEQSEKLGEKYQRIRDRLERYRTNK